MENQEIVCGVYTLVAIENKSSVKIKHLETLKLNSTEKIKDTYLNNFEVEKYINGYMFKCNITNSYLMTTKRQPILYVSIFFEKSLRNFHLMDIFLFFTIEQEVHSQEEFLNKELKGKFSLECRIENKFVKLDEQINVYPGNEKILDQLTNFIKNSEMMEILNDLIKEGEEKISQKFINQYDYSIPKNIISLKNYKLKD
ncbi:Hypothetical protein KVN_LOCUS197 [uncultured virus]|nr:Hypothetical protein KVN_LOCUS197 [uncultured virus]